MRMLQIEMNKRKKGDESFLSAESRSQDDLGSVKDGISGENGLRQRLELHRSETGRFETFT